MTLHLNKKLIGIVVLVIIGISIFAANKVGSKNDIKSFASSYEKTYKANSDFLVQTAAANVTENKTVAVSIEEYGKFLNSLGNNISNEDRLKMANENLVLQRSLDELLSQSDNYETIASDVLLDLNTKASALKDSSLKSEAIKIADLSQEYFETVRKYRGAVVNKSQLKKDLLMKVIDQKGGTSTLLTYLQDKDNQKMIADQNIILDNSDFATVDTNVQQAYARFKGSAGI